MKIKPKFLLDLTNVFRQEADYKGLIIKPSGLFIYRWEHSLGISYDFEKQFEAFEDQTEDLFFDAPFAESSFSGYHRLFNDTWQFDFSIVPAHLDNYHFHILNYDVSIPSLIVNPILKGSYDDYTNDIALIRLVIDSFGNDQKYKRTFYSTNMKLSAFGNMVEPELIEEIDINHIDF